MTTEPDEPSASQDSIYRIAAALTGATILGIRRLNVARTELIQRAPAAGQLVDEAIVLALSGVEPTTKLTAEACRTAASVSPEPVAEAWRIAGDTASAVGRVVHLTGLDQPAPTKRRPRR